MKTADIDAYFERIGYAGPRTPTLETLRALHMLHPRAIPFENLTPLLGLPMSLAPEALSDKLIKRRRGGYCFEHNLLFADVLETIGFDVHCRSARVRWGRPDGAVAARSHMLLLVRLDEAVHVVDVGFGGLTATAPLLRDTRKEQMTPHEPFRVLAGEGYHVIEARIGDDWRGLYTFDDQPQLRIDYEAANWFVSTHPQSIFVTGLMAARPFDGGRYAMMNNRLSIRRGERTETRLLESAEEWSEALRSLFGVATEELPGLNRAFERVRMVA